MVLGSQLVKDYSRRRLCPVSQNGDGCEPPLFAVRETDADVVGVTARVVAIAVAATSDRMASASLSDFAAAVTTVKIIDASGMRRIRWCRW